MKKRLTLMRKSGILIMELSKFDSQATHVANPDFQDHMPPKKSSSDDVICITDCHVPLLQSDTHGPNTNPRDYEGNQSCLRTWKTLARLNQIMEPAMHAPILGKRSIEIKGSEYTDLASKRVQLSNGEHNILAEAAIPMSCLAWNCCRLRNPCTVRELGDLIRAKDPYVVFLAET